MAASFNFGLTICVLVISGCLAGPVNQHGAHGQGGHQTFRITVSVKEASGKEDNSIWIIDNDTTDKDIKTILRFLQEVGHGLGHQNKKYTLPDVMGYRGMQIYHTSAAENHAFVIPKCKFVKLEYLIISKTSGNAMSIGQKKNSYDALRKCIKDKKAAAEAAKQQNTAATKPTTATPQHHNV